MTQSADATAVHSTVINAGHVHALTATDLWTIWTVLESTSLTMTRVDIRYEINCQDWMAQELRQAWPADHKEKQNIVVKRASPFSLLLDGLSYQFNAVQRSSQVVFGVVHWQVSLHACVGV